MQRVRLPPFPVLREVLKMYKLGALKKLSQNFLLDMNLTDKIARKAGNCEGKYVVEVGPGPGGLTRSILQQGPKKLIVIEKDKRFKPALDMLADAYAMTGNEMQIIYEDIMTINLENMFPDDARRSWDDTKPPIHIIGNLPFSVSTALIIKWLKAISEKSSAWSYGRTRMTLTFQKEVAERLVAPVFNDQRCRLSIMAQTWTKPVINFYIPGQAFVPKPEVDAGVVSFVPLIVPQTQHEFSFFEKVTRHIFSFRQKYSQACVGTLFPIECRKNLTAQMFEMANLPPTIRPMQLQVKDIDKLATAYKFLLDKYPELRLYEYRTSRRILQGLSYKHLQIEECQDEVSL